MKTAFVWNIPTSTKPLEYGAYIGTHILAAMCHYDALVWEVGQDAPQTVKDYDCLIVSLFGDMQHVTQIKALHPECVVIALPDSYFDDLFVNYGVWDMNFLSQLQVADMIGYVSESNRQFYGGFFPNKPFVRIPIAIGHDDYFAGIREMDKEDFIITCDHPSITGARNIDYTAQNVATVARIQRETGLRVVYVNTAPKTREYAKIAGLEATFAGYIDFETYARLAACAKIGVDMYALHGYGRNMVMYSYAGTPAIGSTYADFHLTKLVCDPWMTETAAKMAVDLIRDANWYEVARLSGIGLVKSNNSAAACSKQLERVLEQVQQWQHLRQHNLTASAAI